MSRGWKIYKIFRKFLGVSTISIFLLTIYLGSNSSRQDESLLWQAALYVFIFFLVGFIVSVLYTTFWPCPNCGRSFTIRKLGPFGSNLPIFNYYGKCGYEPEK